MREKPILFSGPMVKAILEGRKTQTRRIVKNVTLPFHNGFIIESTDKKLKKKDAIFSDDEKAAFASEYQYARPPYLIGDRMWVRETWCTVPEYDDMRPSNMPVDSPIWYKAQADDDISKWRPSIHMPRWASRITLEVTGVRVERLQDISVEDIIAEGLSTTLREHDACCHLKEQWIDLWNSINADSTPWESNPWVWVIEFEVVK